MGKKVYEETNIAAIAQRIRQHTISIGHGAEKYTVSEMPIGIDLVYDSGFVVGEENGWNNGYTEGYENGYSSGEIDQRMKFWNEFQENGNRVNYYNAFNSQYWNHITFKPTYDLKPVGDARNMFSTFGNTSTYPKMTKILSDAGVMLDTSLVTNARMMFYTCRVSDLPPLDLTSATDIYCLFYDSWRIETIEITLAPNTVTNALGMFSSCTSLINLTIHGVIDVADIDLHWSTKLTKASITSVINALSNGKNGLTITLSQVAKEAAFTAEEWAALIATKPNWTISLV